MKEGAPTPELTETEIESILHDLVNERGEHDPRVSFEGGMFMVRTREGREVDRIPAERFVTADIEGVGRQEIPMAEHLRGILETLDRIEEREETEEEAA